MPRTLNLGEALWKLDPREVETILAVESVPGYRALACKLEEYPAEVECSHLKEQAESLLSEEVAQYMWHNCTKED